MIRTITALLAIVTLSACSTPPPVPDDHFYRLTNAAGSRSAADPVLPGSVWVELPDAAGVRGGRKMLYSDDPAHVRFQQYHYHHWEDAVPQMVQRWLVDRMESIEAATSVRDRRLQDLDFRLQSRIDRFERLIDGENFSARIDIEIRLASHDDPDRPLFKRSYSESVVAANSTMDATVMAFASAMDRIAGQLVGDLESLDF